MKYSRIEDFLLQLSAHAQWTEQSLFLFEYFYLIDVCVLDFLLGTEDECNSDHKIDILLPTQILKSNGGNQASQGTIAKWCDQGQNS